MHRILPAVVFRFEIDDVDAILAYLESIQEKAQGAPAK
jgi:hypothetical protein